MKKTTLAIVFSLALPACGGDGQPDSGIGQIQVANLMTVVGDAPAEWAQVDALSSGSVALGDKMTAGSAALIEHQQCGEMVTVCAVMQAGFMLGGEPETVCQPVQTVCGEVSQCAVIGRVSMDSGPVATGQNTGDASIMTVMVNQSRTRQARMSCD